MLLSGVLETLLLSFGIYYRKFLMYYLYQCCLMHVGIIKIVYFVFSM